MISIADIPRLAGAFAVGLVLTLGGLAYHSRRVSRIGSVLGGLVATGALFLMFVAFLIATGVLNLNVNRAVEISLKVLRAVHWVDGWFL